MKRKRRNKLRIQTVAWNAPVTNALVIESVDWVAA